MEETIYKALEALFGDSLIEDVRSFIDFVVDGLVSVFSNSTVTGYFTLFSAVAGSLLIIFFFIDLTDNASKDMITLERLVLAFIKLLIGFMLILFLPQILGGLFSIVKGIYDTVADLGSEQIDFGIKFFGKKEFPKFEDINGSFFNGQKPAKAILSYLYSVIISIVIAIAGLVSKFVVFLVSISNAIMIIVRAIFSPIAIAQCFDDGQKSNAVRFLKKFVADGLTFAIMLGILYAGSVLQGNIATSVLAASNITELTVDNALSILSNAYLLCAVVAINISIVGAAMKAGQLSQDIVGAH